MDFFDDYPEPIDEFLDEPSDLDFLRLLESIWKTIPFSAWDCPPGEAWLNAEIVLKNRLVEIEKLKSSSKLAWLPSKVSAWVKDVFRILARMDRADPVAPFYVEMAKLLRPSSLSRLTSYYHATVICEDHLKIFLRASAENREPEGLAHFLATLSFTTLPVSERHALVQHVLEQQSQIPTGTSAAIRIGENRGHVVFHAVAPSGEKSKDLERFSALVGKPLALAGIADPDQVERALRQAAPWLSSAIDVLKRRVDASLLGWGGLSFPPILIVGPPGSGKSWLAQKLGALLGLPTRVISAAGSADNMALKGAARSWNSA
ncbi:MAG: hypothetical protein ACP5Q0_05450, partial [Halothiobacillus sp.]